MQRHNTKPVSIRLSKAQLRKIDVWIKNKQVDLGKHLSRSAFMAAAAASVAKQVLSKRTVPLLDTEVKIRKGSTPVTISISFSAAQEGAIRIACTALNQCFSPFVLWAALVFVGKYPIKAKRA